MLSEDLQIEWVDEYLGPGLDKLGYNPTREEKIEFFKLAQENNYKEIKERCSIGIIG